ncbi:unnamed protein product [Staurois parvus]|uniref:Uncharacterized protein n=1 Tax=Staurois parvus TaxID=386267 RepID=A0ABN9ARQ3_9NEOB|nr:unnamed protein product [Staurois parvus]
MGVLRIDALRHVQHMTSSGTLMTLMKSRAERISSAYQCPSVLPISAA